MVIVGEKEESDDVISVRSRDGEERSALKLDDFVAELKEEIASKKID